MTPKPFNATSSATPQDGKQGERTVSCRTSARDLLLKAAGRLFAQHGVEETSLREIAIEAGQRNVSAVRYYFGDKRGLIDALIAERLGRVETARQRLVERAGDLSIKSSEDLLYLFWEPLLDEDQIKGIQWFVRYQQANGGWCRPAGSQPFEHPTSRHILEALHALHPHLPLVQFQYRINIIAMMVLSALSWHESVTVDAYQHWSSRFSLKEVVRMAAGSLAASA